jgi:hypothetical protein
MNKCFAFLFLAVFVARLAAAESGLKTTVLEDRAFCVRVTQLTTNFVGQFRQSQSASRNMGVILDLRLADGDHEAVAATAEFFARLKKPLAILVNGQTRGGAAELALRLRTERLGVLIGSANAAAGLSPDVSVAVNATDEKKFLENPYATAETNSAALGGTNGLAAFVDHMTEAELVRQRIKDGEDPAEETLTPRPAPSQPVIRDPALARALDLIKAVAVLKPAHG